MSSVDDNASGLPPSHPTLPEDSKEGMSLPSTMQIDDVNVSVSSSQVSSSHLITTDETKTDAPATGDGKSSSQTESCDDSSSTDNKVKLFSLDSSKGEPMEVVDVEEDNETFGADNVKKYVDSLKKNFVDRLLEEHLEVLFLSEGGNFAEFLSYRKRPFNEAVRRYFQDHAPYAELQEIIISRLLPGIDHHPHPPQLIASGVGVDSVVSSPSPLSSTPGLTHVSPSQLSSPSVQHTSRPPPPLSVGDHHHHSTHPRLHAHSHDSTIYGISHSAKGSPSTPSSTSKSRSSRVHSHHLLTTTGPVAYGSRAHATRQQSISAVYESSIGSQEQIVERAKQEAQVMQRIAELRREGLWSLRRLPRVQEPQRSKAHWDYLLEEMTWLATDFAGERKWKKNTAKKIARMITKYHQDKIAQKDKEEKEEIARLRKIASFVAKEVRNFWTNVEKLVEFKTQSQLERMRKQALDTHLDYIVGQTEQYTEWLTEGFRQSKSGGVRSVTDSTSVITSVTGDDSFSSTTGAVASDDGDFDPNKVSEEDDEDTIAKEELDKKTSDHLEPQEEIELLNKENELPLEELVPKELLAEMSASRSSVASTSTKSKREADDEEDFQVDESEEDDEETIAEAEAKESGNYDTELQELQDEANLTREQLLEKYAAALQSDYPEVCDADEDDQEEGSQEESEEEKSVSQADEDNEEEEDIGIEYLIHPEKKEESGAEDTKEDSPKKRGPRDITDIAAAVEQMQPKGNTLSTASVVTKVPFLLKHTLREYQHIGLDWLVAMYDKKLNGILADEMGLGKTIQTIALLAHLACEKGIWGPHLIVVPTSVMLNWEMEIKKWCPAFKVLVYYGSPKERREKRKGWTKINTFHICITSYKLVCTDHASFRRKKWKYLILDEAQHIKNFKSQRWQTLLNFNSSRRLLLTGTPLQNNLMELWSLMHFLMPNIFSSHREFREWFVNPVTGMIEGNKEFNDELVTRLHKILRPFLLRRLKKDVEKQLPQKHEHVLLCKLSKRQRQLYEEYMSMTKTKETLASGNFLSVINVLMQLRKVCNHPNLFEPRPITSPFGVERLFFETASLVITPLTYDPIKHISLDSLNLDLIANTRSMTAFSFNRIQAFKTPPKLIEEIDSTPSPPPRVPRGKIRLQITARTQSFAGIIPPSPNALIPPRGQVVLRRPSEPSKIAVVGPTIASPLPEPEAKRVRLEFVSQRSLPNSSVVVEDANPPPSSVGSMKRLPVNNVAAKDSRDIDRLPVNNEVSVSRDTKTYIESIFRSDNVKQRLEEARVNKLQFLGYLNDRKCSATTPYPLDLIEMFTMENIPPCCDADIFEDSRTVFSVGQGNFFCSGKEAKLNQPRNLIDINTKLLDMVQTPAERNLSLLDVLKRFVFCVPKASAPRMKIHVAHPDPSAKEKEEKFETSLHERFANQLNILHTIISNTRTQFPETRLIQYDCGKLQTLDTLLWRLRSEGHRVLIFTQMSRMLDIFEQFLNHHGHIYLRLDGATKIEQRQALMERFNADKRIFCFILSTRSGGIGVNLTGADTVIFYDSDWNPTMDAQAQDRCHRIGQTRDVHIYRLISERTVEENILKKAQQKKLLGDLAIEEGNFTTAFFKHNAVRELFGEGLQGRGDDLRDLLEEANQDSHEANDLLSGKEPPALQEWQKAIEQVEEKEDIVAAKITQAEASAEFAEFDENLPLKEIDEEDEELTKLFDELTPIEKYALEFLEKTQEPIHQEQLKQAEEEIEAQKKEWELERLKRKKEEEEQNSDNNASDTDDIITMSRETAMNQVNKKSFKKDSPVAANTSKASSSINLKVSSQNSSRSRRNPNSPVNKNSPYKTVETRQTTGSPERSSSRPSRNRKRISYEEDISDFIESSQDTLYPSDVRSARHNETSSRGNRQNAETKQLSSSASSTPTKKVNVNEESETKYLTRRSPRSPVKSSQLSTSSDRKRVETGRSTADRSSSQVLTPVKNGSFVKANGSVGQTPTTTDNRRHSLRSSRR